MLFFLSTIKKVDKATKMGKKVDNVEKIVDKCFL